MAKIKFIFNGFIILILTLVSCKDPYNQKISDANSRIYLEEICQEVNRDTCEILKNKIKKIEQLHSLSGKGDAQIILLYDHRYDQLRFKDILEELN